MLSRENWRSSQIFVDGASMPRSHELPNSLRMLPYCKPHLSVSDFKYDFEQLFEAVKQYEQRKRENIILSSPGSANDKVTGEHSALIYSCWRAPQHDARWPGHRELPSRYHQLKQLLPCLIKSKGWSICYRPPGLLPHHQKKVMERASSFGSEGITWQTCWRGRGTLTPDQRNLSIYPALSG